MSVVPRLCSDGWGWLVTGSVGLAASFRRDGICQDFINESLAD